MHHWHSNDLIFWFLSISAEGSKLMKGFRLLIPLVPALGELKEVDFDLELLVIIVEISINHDAHIPFALGSKIKISQVYI